MKRDNLRPPWGAWGRIFPALLIVLLLVGCDQAGGPETNIAPETAMQLMGMGATVTKVLEFKDRMTGRSSRTGKEN